MSGPPCPLCYSERTRFFDKHPKVDQKLMLCRSCGFIFAHPHTPYVHSEKDEIEEDAASGYWANERAIGYYLKWRDRENERLVDWVLGAIAPGRILEVGVGDGPLTRILAPKVEEYWGIEPDTNALARAKQVAGADSHLYPYRSDELDTAQPFSRFSQNFDAILLMSVLEHIYAPREFFATARRLLKPGGHLVISVPSSDRFRFFRRLRRIMGVEPWTYFHVSFFSRSNLLRALEVEGFSLVYMRLHSLLCPESIAYFEARYRSRLLGIAMQTFKAFRLDQLTEMSTTFVVCTPSKNQPVNHLNATRHAVWHEEN